MRTSPLSVVIRHLMADLGPHGGALTDGELLARFLSSRDPAALAALVRRHAPMVWGVCCRLLHNHQDAEDAFQATFLVLVKKAAGVPRHAVANWLYGVARQTAIRLRALAAKRGRRESQVVNMPELRGQESGVRDRDGSDLQAVLDEELGRLPNHYRGVLVLCDLEGMTRKEAARQLAIPEGSVASRLARARVMLAKRLTRRGITLSGGSAAAALAGSASASAPPALVASTIEAASLLAAGKAAATGAISAKVAALTAGMAKAMFIAKIKSVLAMVLVALALAGAAGLIYQTQAAASSAAGIAQGEQPAGTRDQKPSDDRQVGANPPAHPKQQPAKTDQERMVGNWFITNDESMRKGEMWVITEDSILMHAKHGGANAHHYAHRLDASKTRKQIDITVSRANGRTVGVIKGIYVLDGDELRLCLGEMSTDRPAAFPEKPKPGEVLILQRASSGASPPKAKENPPANTDLERMAGLWTIVNGECKWRDDGLGAKGQIWEIGKHQIVPDPFLTGIRTRQYFQRLDAVKSPKQIDITVTAASNMIGADIPINEKNRILGVIKGIYEFDRGEIRLCLGEMGKDRPAAFPDKPKQGEVLILQGGPEPKVDDAALKEAEKLRVLIDKVLTAHGGEDKLNKLTSFTMTVKHSNLETQYYFVQPPRSFRWETTHPDRTSKRIVILFPEGRRWWRKEPNGQPMEFRPTGAERTMEYHLDYVKFFGPRQVLRLKDTDHRVALLDDEVKIGDRAAVGVQVTGPQFNRKMYFDKETHLLLKSGAVTYSDYKTFDGIPVAQKENDGYLLPQVTDFRAVNKFDAKLFQQP